MKNAKKNITIVVFGHVDSDVEPVLSMEMVNLGGNRSENVYGVSLLGC